MVLTFSGDEATEIERSARSHREKHLCGGEGWGAREVSGQVVTKSPRCGSGCVPSALNELDFSDP